MNRLQMLWKKSFTPGPQRTVVHLLFWLLYFTVFAGITVSAMSATGQQGRDLFLSLAIVLVFNMVILILTYYLIAALVYPLFIRQHRYLFGIVLLLACFLFFAHLTYLGNLLALHLKAMCDLQAEKPSGLEALVAKDGYLGFVRSGWVWVQLGFSFGLFMGVPLTGRFFRDHLRLQERENSLEKQNLKLEMHFLKSQIQPHFLFNTLNNIYSLIVHGEQEKSAAMVSGLSSLLRYTLYDSRTEFSSLEKELTMLRNFIDLEAVRSDHTRLEVHLPEAAPAGKLPAFLLLPLVENAFKHGVNAQLREASLRITLEIGTDKLLLTVDNSFDPEYRKSKAGGLGLVNLRKRLDYYYGKHYALKQQETGNHYSASLKIPLLCPR